MFLHRLRQTAHCCLYRVRRFFGNLPHLPVAAPRIFHVPVQLDAIPPLPELMPQTCPPDQIPQLQDDLLGLRELYILGYDNNKVHTTECQHLLQHAAKFFPHLKQQLQRSKSQ